jgi:hypothetical protein
LPGPLSRVDRDAEGVGSESGHSVWEIEPTRVLRFTRDDDPALAIKRLCAVLARRSGD